MKKISLLIVEDEAAIRDMVHFALTPAGFQIAEAEDTQQAKQLIAQNLPDLILLDWMLPGASGIEFAQQLKKDTLTKDIPIIMLSAKAEEENKIKGLEVGADDYITKPFSPRELIARIKTVLRRGPLVTPEGIIKVYELCLNLNNHTVTIADQVIELAPIEYKLLHFFLSHMDRVYTRTQLLDQVWGMENYIDERTVDVQIRRLRDRLKPYQYDQYIKTVRGAGYQFIGNKA